MSAQYTIPTVGTHVLWETPSHFGANYENDLREGIVIDFTDIVDNFNKPVKAPEADHVYVVHSFYSKYIGQRKMRLAECSMVPAWELSF